MAIAFKGQEVDIAPLFTGYVFQDLLSQFVIV